jgi:protein-tyrosine sulfotransferase
LDKAGGQVVDSAARRIALFSKTIIVFLMPYFVLRDAMNIIATESNHELIKNSRAVESPIFILGVLQRSGTNYLYNLLLLHPHCGDPAPVWEDYLCHHADLLSAYAQAVAAEWKIDGVDTLSLQHEIHEYIGNGIVRFLQSKSVGKRLIAKTPSVHNLNQFFKLFPKAKLIIIVRDGRALVESGRRSFGWNYQIAMKRWAEAAAVIRSFQEQNGNSESRFLIVRYEDIFTNVEQEIRRILNFAGLDANLYDFNAACNLPVRGTSELKQSGDKALHWDPVQKKADFAPTHRSDKWGRALHERFNHIAGEQLKYFGYEKKTFASFALFWKTWNWVMDIPLFLLWNTRRLKRLNIIVRTI